MTTKSTAKPERSKSTTYRVVVIEWFSHKAFIKAGSVEEAEAKARDLWDDKVEHEAFKLEDNGIEGITAEAVSP